MSGHSKWSQIKHRKAATDSKKAAIFGKLAKTITVAARNNPDPKTNFQLRAAIDYAKSFDMPSDNIERVLSRARDKDSQELFDVVVEAVGPGNIALIITAITDNKNRTVHNIKNTLAKNGGHMVNEGSLSWMFDLLGIIRVPLQSLPPSRIEQLELAAVDAGAQDIRQEDGTLVFSTGPENLHTVQDALTGLHASITSATSEYVAKNLLSVPPQDQTNLDRLYDILDEDSDVQNIFSNENTLPS